MQIPWLFPIFIFSLTFNKIPWLFPDFCQVWNFPDFSLTAGHPVITWLISLCDTVQSYYMIDFSMWHSPVLLHDWFLHVTQSNLITWFISPCDTVQSYYMIDFSMWHSPVLLHNWFLHVTQSSLITWLISPCDTVQSYYMIDFSIQLSLITWFISRHNWASSHDWFLWYNRVSSHDWFLDTIEPHHMTDVSMWYTMSWKTGRFYIDGSAPDCDLC